MDKNGKESILFNYHNFTLLIHFIFIKSHRCACSHFVDKESEEVKLSPSLIAHMILVKPWPSQPSPRPCFGLKKSKENNNICIKGKQNQCTTRIVSELTFFPWVSRTLRWWLPIPSCDDLLHWFWALLILALRPSWCAFINSSAPVRTPHFKTHSNWSWRVRLLLDIWAKKTS